MNQCGIARIQRPEDYESYAESIDCLVVVVHVQCAVLRSIVEKYPITANEGFNIYFKEEKGYSCEGGMVYMQIHVC